MIRGRFAEARVAAEAAVAAALSVGARRMAGLAENLLIAAEQELGHIDERCAGVVR